MHTKFRTTLLVLCGLTLAPTLTAADGDQGEIEVDCSTIFSEPIPLLYGSHTTNCAISPSTDLDTFEFLAVGGEDVQITVDGRTLGFDPTIEVYDASLALVDSASCSSCTGIGCGPCSVTLDLAGLAAGVHTVVVSDAGNDEAGNYTLQIEEIAPSREIALLPYDFGEVTSVTPTTDMDWWSFYGEASSRVRIQVDGQTLGFDASSVLYDPNGDVVDSSGCSSCTGIGCAPCSFSLTVDLPAISGMYTLSLYDSGRNETGTANVTVACLLGCPTTNGMVGRNGSGSNPAWYSSTRPAAIAGCWSAEVDATTEPTATLGVVVLCDASTPPLPSKWGEILVDLGGLLCQRLRTVDVDGIARFSEAIPNEPTLAGRIVYTQAALLIPGDTQLTNAIDYLIGY